MVLGKKQGLLMMVVMFLFLICSCASMESQFKKAKEEDTIVAYKNFLWKYPKGEYSEIAKKRIADIQREEECKRNLSKLKAIGYDGYSCKVEYDSSLPIKPDCISIKIIGKVKRSVKFIGGYVGTMDLSPEEQEEANNFFEQSLYSSFSPDFKIQEDCIWQLVVVCGEGGGIKIGSGQLIEGKVFFLDNKLKKLIYYSEVDGVGKEVTDALANLASNIKENISRIAAPAT